MKIGKKIWSISWRVVFYPVLITITALFVYCLVNIIPDVFKIVHNNYNEIVHSCMLDKEINNIKEINIWDKYCSNCGKEIENNTYRIIKPKCPKCNILSSDKYCSLCGHAIIDIRFEKCVVNKKEISNALFNAICSVFFGISTYIITLFLGEIIIDDFFKLKESIKNLFL